jgi:NADH:ubiquinone oxidoreductase subunit 3 (subunit A)
MHVFNRSARGDAYQSNSVIVTVDGGLITSPISLFVISLIIAGIIYAIAGGIAPNPGKSDEKLSSYACGEKFPSEAVPVSINLFEFACLFMIFDVLAMVFVLSMGLSTLAEPMILYLSLIYAAIVLVALLVVMGSRKR